MATYIETYTSEDWSVRFANAVNILRQALQACNDAGVAWYKFSYGQSNEQLAALPQLAPWTTADVANVQAVGGALSELYDVLNGTATVPSDKNYMDILRYFG